MAIVGTGLRLPGGVRDAASYWDLLHGGVDAVTEVPLDRWDPDGVAEAPREGGFLDQVAMFDAAFFGISPREALELDPAQRLLLEVAWEALEDAAIAPDALGGTPTGVYVGLGLSDYGRRHFLSADLARLTAYSGTGAFLSVAAGRIAYTLGLNGPAMTVDTACSSSLVSVHLAVAALRRGEVDLALAGGANLLLSPEPSVYFARLGALAHDGRCKTFSADADGYGRGEGAGVVVLKRLADALADGDRVLAVVRGTAVNQDGRSNGLTAPSGRAQQAVIRAALDNAGVSPEAVGYIEAHGTGTPLGDPIEIDALRAVFSAREVPLWVGSAKTNFGHLETAAGVAGLVKLALALDRQVIPPHLHAGDVNPRISLDTVAIPAEPTPWTGPERIGGVSSFGLSGTNAHLVLSAAPEVARDRTPSGPAVLQLSGRTTAQLTATAAAWAEALPGVPWPAAVTTARVGRAQLAVRLAIPAADADTAAAMLRDVAAGGRPQGVSQATAATGSAAPGVVFLFTGQGAQHPGMGRDLYAADPVFAAAFDDALAALDPLLDRPLRDVMWGEEAAVHDTQWTQPALFALQVALAAMWRERGVVPDAVVGHSVGELAAAHVAGAMTLAEGARLVVERGRLMAQQPRTGAMAAIFAPEEAIAAAVSAHDGRVSIAAVNNPTETVISGHADAVEAVLAPFEAAGTRVRRLTVSHAFHSVLMDPMLADLEAVAASMAWSTPQIPVISNHDGAPVGDRLADPAYWARHARGAVRFAAGMETLLTQGHTVFLELGPRPVLAGMGRRCAGDRPATFIGSLHPDRDDALEIAAAQGALWAHGADVVLPTDGPRARLPLTPFQGERYWLDAPEAVADSPYGDWVLQVAWRTAQQSPEEVGGRWAVVGDAALTAALEAGGAAVVDLFDPELTGIVYAPTETDAGAVAWEATTLAQRLSVARGFVKLWLVGQPTIDPGHAVLRGVGQVLGAEHPDRWGGYIEWDGAQPAAVVDALHATDDATWVQVHDGVRRVARLVRSRSALAGDRLPVDEGAVLVTGGFGALGSQVAAWLADRGARTLILTGRSGAASEAALAQVAALRARGVTVHAVAADVSDPAAVAGLYALAPVVGVVHCAGASDDALLIELEPERFDPVLAAKVTGTRNLSEAAPEGLRFFVLFSSAAGWLGVPGQDSYAAANAFMDGFAAWRRAQGLPATSIAYGPWSGDGMAGDLGAAAANRWAREGVHLIDPADALGVLDAVGVGGQASVLVAPFDWATWARHRTVGGALAAELVPAQAAPAALPDSPPVALVDALRSAPEGARRTMARDHVQQVVSRVLGFGPDHRIGPQEGFFDAGMDSMMAMDLRERLQATAGAPLSATIAFDFPTVDAATDYLLEVLDLGPAPAAPAPVALAVVSDEPIAIVGAACRLPGGVVDLEGFWRVLSEGVDAITEVPRDRFDVDRYFDPEPGTPGRTYCRYGGFVDGIESFDPQHYGISPREAAGLDPQQRMLLDTTWHALEEAGIAPRSLAQSATGVFVGIGQSEYWHRFDPTAPDASAYAGTGNEPSFAAGRVAYTLGLRGPTMSINTACSSALVGVHQAAAALRAGQCDLAVAGGVNAIVGPENTLWMSLLTALAPDGRCKPFDAAANGYVRSEGCGMVVLKRLSDAQRDGDRIHAVVAGSAVNHDGASSGLTVPSGPAQQAVIRAALRDAAIAPHEVGLVECHGTGTPLGDPIEVRALGAVLATERDAPLYLGAAKSNVGHLEAGAGIVGLLKAMLALERGVVPPVVHFSEANPALPLDEFPAVHIPTASVAWPRGDTPRIAGVSSFGISGTNAHVLLREAPEAPAPDRQTARPAALVTWSSRTEAGLAAQAGALAAHLRAHDVPLADLAYTQNTGRSGGRHRAALVATDAAQAAALLAGAAAAPPAILGRARDDARLAFLCTGAGPQTWDMGRALYEVDPVFRAALDEAAAAADEVLPRPLKSVLFPEEGERPAALHDLSFTQPAMFALQWAMAELWRSFGVQPDAVIGHSTGQYIAACLAGVFDLSAGMRLMAARARLMSSQPRIGSMVAVFASEDIVRAYLDGHHDVAAIAAVNGPAETVISGRSDFVDPVADRIEADGIEIRRLKISHAAHSPLMDPILDEFEELVGGLTLQRPRIPLIENVRGELAGDEVLSPAYWREHMRQGVQFAAGARTLADRGFRVFLELGNHPVLAGAAARTLEGVPDVVFVPSMRREHAEWPTLLEAAGRLWTAGVSVDFAGLHRAQPGGVARLPGTVFQTQRHWVERTDRAASTTAGHDWTYAIRWDEIRPNVEAFGTRGERPLLILADAGGLGARLAAKQQRPAVVVSRDDLDPADPAAFEALLAAHDPAGIVLLWALDAAGDTPTTAAAPAVQAALHLLQAAARHGQPPMWWVTRGAAPTGPGSPALDQAPLLGLATVAQLELADQSLVTVDLDPGDEGLLALELVLNSGVTEDQLAIRDGRHLVRRLARVPASGEVAPAIRAEGTYLVTGGLGALGLRIARWLVDAGAGSVVLTSRSAPGPAAQEEIARLEQRASVVVARGDVGDPADVAAIVAEAGAVTGVFHAAGVIDDGSLLTMDWDRFPPVWRAKLDGAHHLDAALPDAELFVLFSSAASLIGSAGQAAYGAGNAYLDALAQARRARGRHAVSLCWGPWADAGLATASTRAWEAGGVRPLAPGVAIGVMAQLLAAPDAAVAVVDLDWAVWPGTLPRVPALVGPLVPEQAPVAATPQGLAGTLAAAPPERRAGVLAEALSGQVGHILGLPGSEIDRGLGFFDAGMDSLMAVELANRLRGLLDVPIPATVAFDHPTIDALTAWLLGALSLGDAASVPGAPVAVALDPDAPIAVIGVSCRMPGGANDPEAFWALLRSGRDPMVEVPATRWDLSVFYDPIPGTPGKMYVRDAGWVDQELVEGFDPEFFGISGREAASMDPQQRMLLEVSYEALERAGVATDALQHSSTGVYVGVGDSGYLQRFQEAGGALYSDPYAGTGNLSAFVSGRVAYALGVHGPNLALNTACSSSLVAVHLATQALRAGECSLALAGGVHLMLSPENFVYVAQLKALSADGRCKTFDARADGYGRAEGCGMVALKRLSDAERDGDPVLAVIRGSAVGHDGPSSGLTVPYGPAQVQVLSDALARSGVDPLSVSYLEAHGTGTVLGDPIEVHAIEEVYGPGRDADNPLHLGAVKAHVGHMEVAAGAASLVKMVLALQHREIPPHLHFEAPNPDIDLAGGSMVIDAEPTPWSAPDGVLRAGISAFGLAGTNVHVVLEEGPTRAPVLAAGADRDAHVLTLSARSAPALRDLAARTGTLLVAGAALPDVAYSAATTRRAYEHRLAVTATDGEQAAERLTAYVTHGEAPQVVTALAPSRPPRLAWLFSGQGSQYPGMGRGLYERFAVYREWIDRSASVLDPLLDRPLLDVLHSDAGDPAIHDTTYTQPALFAHQVALAALWRSWGVQPSVVAGHSIGQLSAACVAGVFSLEDGLRLVAARGRMMGSLPRDGSMAAVFATEDAVGPHLAPYGDHVGIAAINDPGGVVISGRTEAVDAVLAALAADGVEHRRLTVSHAFHSPLMDPILDAFEQVAATVSLSPPAIEVLCNASGGIAGAADLTSARYWRDLIRSPVRFADNLVALEEHGAEVFLEIGPHTSLLGMGKRTLSGRHLAWFGSLRRDADGPLDLLLPSLGGLWTRGIAVDWRAFDAPYARQRVQLPTYPWQRRRCWIDKPEFPAQRDPATDWLVHVDWVPGPPPVAPPQGDWLVVGAGADADALDAALVAHGATVTRGPAESVALEAGRALFVADPGDALGATTALLRLVQRLQEARRAPALTVVTRGAVAAAGPPTDPDQGAVWGLARVVRLEAPDLRIAVVDLDPNGAVDGPGWLRALDDGERAPEVALRGGQRWVARLVRGAFAGAPVAVQSDGAYLVTGGLGGLGLRVAAWLSTQGAGAVVLTGRSAPSEAAQAALSSLREAGTDVQVAQGDVAEAADVARIIADIRAGGRPLRGVIHAAGVLRDAALLRLDAEAMRTVFRPKVAGSHNLLQSTADDPLDFLVLFSGGASMLGSPGQGNYAAANAVLDALAPWARAQGRPVTAVNWGAWAEAGMAARLGEAHAARQAEEGIRPLPIDRGLTTMGRLLGHERAQVGVLNVDWDRFVASFHRGVAPPALTLLATPAAPTAPQAAAETPAMPPLIAALQPVADDREGWRPVIDEVVYTEAMKVLQRDAARPLDRTQALVECGLDSLLAVDLKNALMDVGVDLPVARVMTGPSIEQLGQMVVEVLAASGGISSAEAADGEPLNAWVSGPRNAAAVDGAPPLHPVLTHLLAALFGVVMVVGLYLLTARVAGFERDLSHTAEEQGEAEGELRQFEPGTPAQEQPTPQNAKGRGRKAKSKAKAQEP